MAFDPDAFLAVKPAPTPTPKAGFDPDAFLKSATPAAGLGGSGGSAEERLRQQEAVDARVANRTNRERITAENAQPGVPLDQDSSLPLAMRVRTSLEPDQARKAEIALQDLDVISTRVTPDGKNVVVRMAGPDGTPVDRLLNPTSLSFSDIPGNAGALAKAAGVGALATMTGGMGLAPTALAMGAGSAAQNAATVGASRLAAGQTLDAPEIARSSAIEGGINAAFPLAGAAAAKVGQVLTAPFRSGGAIAGGEAAATRLGIPLSAGQRVDSGVLARSTALPGTGGKALAAEQTSAIRAATDREIGPSGRAAVPSEAAIAAEVKPVLAAEAGAAQQAAAADVATQTADAVAATTAARQAELDAAAKAAQDRIRAELDSGLVSSNHTASEVSTAIRDKVKAIDEARRASFAPRYAALDEEAAKQGLTASTDNIAALANDVNSQVTDAVLTLAPGISKIGSINEILAGQNLTLPQLRELKNQLYDMTKAGLAPGEATVPGRYINKLSKAVDADYQATIAKGTPEFRDAASKLSADYRAQITPLRQADVAKAFAGPEEAGFQGANELVTNLFSGKGNLTALQGYRDVLGANSPEYKLLLRQGVKELEQVNPVTGMIDADKFLSRLKSLHPDMKQEVLGPMVKGITENAELMAAAQGTKISERELTDALLANPKNGPKLFQEALERQKAADMQFNQKVLQQARDGTITPQTLSNDTFVTRLVDTSDAAQARQIMTSIASKNPAAAESIRQRALVNILDDVKAQVGNTPVTTGEGVALNFKKLTDNYLDPKSVDKYRAFIGDSGVKFLQDIAQVNEVIARSALSAQGATSNAANLAAQAAGMAVPGTGGLLQGAMRTVATVPEWFLGNAQRWGAVRDFLATGQVPPVTSLGGKAARGALLTAPATARAATDILADKEPTSR